jgi:hypothetical protein
MIHSENERWGCRWCRRLVAAGAALWVVHGSRRDVVERVARRIQAGELIDGD